MPNKPTPKSQVNEKTTNTSAKPPEQQKQLFSNFDITLGVLALFLGVALYVWQYANIGIVGKLLWAYKPIQVYGSSGSTTDS